MNMVEIIARAIWDDREQHQYPRCRLTWEQGSILAHKFAFDHARTALLAIRDNVTPGMVAEGERAASIGIGKPSDDDALPRVWHAMIDQALAEGGE